MHTKIFLTGFMGSGKTTVGQIIARELNAPFIDLDEQIEQAYSLKTTEIFEKYGESEFRKMELDQVKRICENTETQVISLGGGAFLQEEIRNICMNNGTVFFLSVSWDIWKQRLDSLVPTRPLLQGKTEGEIHRIFAERQTIYQTHHYSINADKSAEQIAHEILTYL
ncbi:shikimate kinase [Cytobacillus gottheilii]|uniref:shikimate kinase n=1 Tax=Cytobacillus gottheilii TaxID=859144 RepID=UPI0009BA23B2|nr:shikimate kinase [Cytobacillus gottheilii]